MEDHSFDDIKDKFYSIFDMFGSMSDSGIYKNSKYRSSENNVITFFFQFHDYKIEGKLIANGSEIEILIDDSGISDNLKVKSRLRSLISKNLTEPLKNYCLTSLSMGNNESLDKLNEINKRKEELSIYHKEWKPKENGDIGGGPVLGEFEEPD